MRHRRAAGISVGLLAALAAGAALLALPDGKKPAPSAAPGPQTVTQVWGVRPAAQPARLPDGTDFTPLAYAAPGTAVGTAPTPDRSGTRLLAGARELRRLNADGHYSGVTIADGRAYWAETAVGSAGSRTSIWAADLAAGNPARQLAADGGDAVFFGGQYDLVIADGRVHWAAAAKATTPTTEVRSVPVGGGATAVRRVPGAFALSAWPWLVSASGAQAGPTQLLSLADGSRKVVPAQPNELVTCGPTWCRTVLMAGGAGGATRLAVMRADGTDRRDVATSPTSPAVVDVGVLDRFEVLATAGRAEGIRSGDQRLTLYDIAGRRLVEVADGARTVAARGGFLWWSTGSDEALTWHVLDLRTLR